MTTFAIGWIVLFFSFSMASAQTPATTSTTTPRTAPMVLPLEQAWQYHSLIKIRNEELRAKLRELDERKPRVMELQLKTGGGASRHQRMLRQEVIELRQSVVGLIQEFEAVRLKPEPSNPRFKALLKYRSGLMDELDWTRYIVNVLANAIPPPD